MLKPTHLRALAEVVRTGSFAEAAQALGYTPTAVSQQVAALERSLGVRLVVREPHRICCTPAAVRLAERARHALEVLATLADDARALARGQSGRLRIGTALDPAAGLLAPTLRRLRTECPQIEVVVEDSSADTLVERVSMGSVDLALIYDYPAAPRTLAPELTAVTLAQQPWQLVMPAGWPHAPGPSAPALSDLADHAWVVGLGAGHGHRALAVVCAAAGFTPRISATTTNRDIVLGMVSAELGIGVLPSVPWPANGEVSLRPFVSAGATRRTVAVHVREETDVMVLAAVRTLRAVAHPGSLPSSVPDSVPDTVPDTLPGSHPAGGR